MKYVLAPEIKERIDVLVEQIEFKHVQRDRIYCIRSLDAKTRAIARIWGFSKIFHEVAGLPVTYIIEVNRKRFDKLDYREQTKVLIHELMHIPSTFSGALRSHKGNGFHICDREVERLCRKYNI
ncbi:metallopeptidase [Candidatus Woesebacteria bacterium]|nr:metallopeptidase [Candidatus Woesebacteria bacterium]